MTLRVNRMKLCRLTTAFVAFNLALLAIGQVNADEIRPGVFRTPDSQFANLPGYDFAPNYLTINGLRVHYLDEGPKDGPVVLLLHGEPSWSYLYRKMIPVFTAAGYRSIAPDLVGFGRSDKPADRAAHSYNFHVDVITQLVRELELDQIHAFFQDWGGLIGLRIVTENEGLFEKVAVGNTALPEGPGEDGLIIGNQFTEMDANAKLEKTDGFPQWLRYSQVIPVLNASYVLQYGTVMQLPSSILDAYDAPFPDDRYKAGPRVMPTLVASQNATNSERWKVLENWSKPFLTAFSDSDPILGNGFAPFRERVPGSKNQPHTTVTAAGHFLQEDKGQELAKTLVDWFEQ